MDVFEKVFGCEMQPHRDEHTAIKLILSSLIMDKSVDRLIELLDPSYEVGCLEGEPGWELERIEKQDRARPAYQVWPDWADYRAYVDPELYELSTPEAYYKSTDFRSYLKQAMDYCRRRNIDVHRIEELGL